MGYGIQYKCNDGKDYYCTSSSFVTFSENIESIAEFAQQKTALKIAKGFTKSTDMEAEFGEGKLFVIKVVKVPLQIEEVQLVKLKPGYRIYSEEEEEYYKGSKKSTKRFGYHNNFDELHCSTVFKTEKEAQKTIDAILDDYHSYAYKYDPSDKQYEQHVKSYEPYYLMAKKLKIVYIE
ncbi:hypothetical protein RCIP0023_00094 [Klebsiella phage RCIP0023]